MTDDLRRLAEDWVLGLYEDDEDTGFIGELGGSICLIDDLHISQARQIVSAHNARVTLLHDRIAALERVRDMAKQMRPLLNEGESDQPIDGWEDFVEQLDAALAGAKEARGEC